jgi:biotin transport system substrate-specific component
MLVATFVLGQLARYRLDQKFLTALPSMLIGTITTFSFGLIWLHQFTGESWSWAIEKGLTPFIVGEVLKIAIAGTSLPAIWRVVNRKNS